MSRERRPGASGLPHVAALLLLGWFLATNAREKFAEKTHLMILELALQILQRVAI